MARQQRHAGGEGLGGALARLAGRRAAAWLLRAAASALAVPLGKLLLVCGLALAAAFLVIIIAAAAVGIAEADSGPSQAALAEIPPDYVPVLLQASRESGVPWQVLAALVKVESGFGRNPGPSPAGAVGPCQFLPATWAVYGIDGDGDGTADPWNVRDCIPATARYLVANGAPGDLGAALLAYNHDEGYVRTVLLQAMAYGFRPWAAGLPAFQAPLIAPAYAPVTDGFSSLRKGALHGAVDLGGRLGDPVWAAGDGVVTFAGGAPENGEAYGCGLWIEVDHGGGVATRYCHLQAILVMPGRRVRQGEVIGRVGYSGWTEPPGVEGAHLHFEVRLRGVPQDPMLLVPDLRLLPGAR